MATLNISEVFNPDTIGMDRFRRIVEESYEVAFVLCNKDMEEFSASKIFDIFSQVFTTAYVLNTGYWPFFSTTTGQCLCICGRFGVPCRHTKNSGHWIDLQPIDHDIGTTIFYPRLYGPIAIQDYDVLVKAVDGNRGFYINIILNVFYQKGERGRPRRDKIPRATQKDVPRKTYPIAIFSRFHTISQYYSPIFTIIFQPNPFYNEHYGTIFKKLIPIRAQEFCAYQGEYRQNWCILFNQMPITTFLNCQVNVPVFKLSQQILVSNQPQVKHRQNYMRNKSVQTNDLQIELGFANNTLWNEYCVDDSTSISKSLRSFATNAAKEEQYIVQDSQDYDNQFPVIRPDKVIQPPLYGNSLPSISVEHQEQNNMLKRKIPTWSCKEEPDSTSTARESTIVPNTNLPYLFPDPGSSMNYSKAVKTICNDPINPNEQNKSCDQNFPPSKNCPQRLMTQSEIDEEFELIESVIKSDLLEQDGNLDWWYKNKV